MIKKWLMINLAASLVILGIGSPGMAKLVTKDEALTIAKNWITLVLHTQKKWGESKTAEVADIQEFKRNGKVLGYLCKVRPRGFIVISLHRKLDPVKAYSETSDLDPSSEKGMGDLLKTKMEKHLTSMVLKAGPLEVARDEDLEGVFELDHGTGWESLESSPSAFETRLGAGEETLVTRGPLLSTSWHQTAPYNDLCPMGYNLEVDDWGNPILTPEPCNLHPDIPDLNAYNHNALAGCTAIAGAQVMKYWAWPPRWSGGEEIHWKHMLDRYVWNGESRSFDDPNGNPVTDTQRLAVAHLIEVLGREVGMDYDCHRSGAPLGICTGCTDLLDALEDRINYHPRAWYAKYEDYTDVEWFELIKSNINSAIPMPYSTVGKHSFVCDGWQEYQSGGVVTDRFYHMNWGHDNDSTTWYRLDSIPYDEEMIVNLVPDAVLDPGLTDVVFVGSDDGKLPVRYIVSLWGEDVFFLRGQALQFLHTGAGISGKEVYFYGAPNSPTLMFSGGIRDVHGFTGIIIEDGRIGLKNGGSIRLPLPARDNPWHASIGVFGSDQVWRLDSDHNGRWEPKIDKQAGYGLAGDVPIVGDWSGSGTTKIGVKRGGDFLLDYNGNGIDDGAGVDRYYPVGLAGAPVAGDWNGDGKDEIGVFYDGKWYLDKDGDGVIKACSIDLCISFGSSDDIPVVGDWNGDGKDEIGTFSNTVWKLDYDGDHKWSGPPNDRVYSFGWLGDSPVVGDWSGNGITKIGVMRLRRDDQQSWWLDYDGDGSWGGYIVDRGYLFALKDGQAVSGRW